MKCTQCNNTSLIENVTYFNESYDGGRMDPSLKTFVCDKCGHLEQFYMKPIKRRQELDKLRTDFEKKTFELNKNIKYYDDIKLDYDTRVKVYLKNEKNRLNLIISNKNNTVKINEKAKNELKNLKTMNLSQFLDELGLSEVDYPDRKQYSILVGEFNKKKTIFEHAKLEIEKKFK